MDIQTITLITVFTSVMGVEIWLRIILKKAFQIMVGHSILIVSDTTQASQIQSETTHK